MIQQCVRAVARLGVLLVFVAAPSWAGFGFADEFGTDPAKVADKKVDLSLMNGDGDGSDSGRGPNPYLKALHAPPARIALISFYVWDCGNKKENSWNTYGGNYTYHVTSTRTNNVTEKAVDMLANELHDASIGALKEAFATVDSKLLTPDEFLDTDAKKQAYANFNPEHNFMEKIYKTLQGLDTDSFHFTGAPSGYRVIGLTNLSNIKRNKFQLATTGVGVGTFANAAGYDLATALGVDAVAVLYNVVQAEKKSINMRAAAMYLFGPNPVKDTGQSLYWKGHQFSGVYLDIDEVPFVKTDDGKLVEADYAGYAIVAKALGLRMAQHLKEKTGWDGKPRAAAP